MNARQATKFMFWAGEKIDAGDSLTEEEKLMMQEAKEATLESVKKYMRLTPKDWKYNPGQPFK